jgi:hypothetical protein
MNDEIYKMFRLFHQYIDKYNWQTYNEHISNLVDK